MVDAPQQTGGEPDPLGPEERWARLEPMVLFMAGVGALLTIAAWKDWAWAFILGLVLTAVWIAGFIVARNGGRRWFRW